MKKGEIVYYQPTLRVRFMIHDNEHTCYNIRDGSRCCGHRGRLGACSTFPACHHIGNVERNPELILSIALAYSVVDGDDYAMPEERAMPIIDSAPYDEVATNKDDRE